MHQDASNAGATVPAKDEAHGSPQSAGPSDNQKQRLNPIVGLVPHQGGSGEFSIFARLCQQFSLLGLNLYPLDGKSLLVVSPALGMSKVLPDIRAAQVYLRQIGRVQ